MKRYSNFQKSVRYFLGYSFYHALHYVIAIMCCWAGMGGLSGCLQPPIPPFSPATEFAPTSLWVITTDNCAIIDVSLNGNIVAIGDNEINQQYYTTVQIFNSEGTLLRQSEARGIAHDVVAGYSGTDTYGAYMVAQSVPGEGNTSFYNSLLLMRFSSLLTSPYKRYDAAKQQPAQLWYSFESFIVGPSIARAAKETKFGASSFSAAWMVGSFYDKFQPFETHQGFQNECPSFGKTDCFVVKLTDYSYLAGLMMIEPRPSRLPIHHQWGGPEHDLAYDIASDSVGNATIFLRAGSDFAITSATQSLVKMKVGYNIVCLDTNGLLTRTFPVRLDAHGEISDVEIALAPNNVVYILAKDEQRQQYFLAKITPTATEWIHYFGPTVASSDSSPRGADMGLTTDSKGNVYITGNVKGITDFGNGKFLSVDILTNWSEAFVAKYSPTNICLGALKMGTGTGVGVRLSPQEDALYVSGRGYYNILGQQLKWEPRYAPRNGLGSPPSFLVKLKIQ